MAHYNTQAIGLVKPERTKREITQRAAAAAIAMSMAAIEALHEAGAHLVLCKDDKTPLRSWRQPASLDEAIHWIQSGGLVGLVPSSVRLAIFDIDYGGMGSVKWLHGELGILALAILKSRQRGHYHMPVGCEDASELRNRKLWRDDRAIGDLRANGGYVVMWQPVGYAKVVKEWAPQVEAAHIKTIAVQQELPSIPAKPKPKLTAAIEKVEFNFSNRTKLDTHFIKMSALTNAREGNRHNTLIAQLGFVLAKRCNLAATQTDAIETGLVLNNLMPNGLPQNEVVCSAIGLWNKLQRDKASGKHDDHFSNQQRQRQRLGVASRRERHQLDLRDNDIHRLHKAGMSHRKLAKQFRLSVRAVQRVLDKPCPSVKNNQQGFLA